MWTKKKTRLIFAFAGGWLLVSLMVGCTAGLWNSRGYLVEQENRIELKMEGRKEGVWQTRDLQIGYAYLRENNRLSISGTVWLDRYLTTGFSTLEHLFVNLYFLDDQGRVMKTERMRSFGHRRWILVNRLLFERALPIPEGAVSFSFGYYGRVSEGGGWGSENDDSGAITWDFWEVPKSIPRSSEEKVR